MKSFLKKIALFSIPFVVYLSLIALIDPFNYLNREGWIDGEVKANIALDVEPHLFKLIEYENAPKKNIALGDSRTNSLFHSMPDTWANLSYDGGSLKEMIQTFWYTDELIELDTVLISVNLRMYNTYHKRFWVEETVERKKNFFSYAFSKYAFRASYISLLAHFSNSPVDLQKPAMNKEKFWAHQLNKTAPRFFEKHAHPDGYLNDLEKIMNHCTKKGIVLLFWIPPTHTDFQERIADFKLQDAQETFVQEIQTLGKLYDFNFPNELTKDSVNFKDPVHFTKEIGALIYSDIFNSGGQFSRYSSPAE